MNKKSYNSLVILNKKSQFRRLLINLSSFFAFRLLGRYHAPMPLRVEQQEFRF